MTNVKLDLDKLEARARAATSPDIPVQPATVLALVAIARQMDEAVRLLRWARATLDHTPYRHGGIDDLLAYVDAKEDTP